MKADPAAQLRLLELQSLDSMVDQLRHQKVHPPQAGEITELLGKRADVDGRLRDQKIVVDDLEVKQKRADADVEQVKARRARDQDRMDSGAVADPKALERMQHEMETLSRRITTLEDEELEVMEELEEARSALDELSGAIDEIDRRLGELTGARDDLVAGVDAELADVLEGRAPLAAELTGSAADLVVLYDKLRASKGGVGAAALRARQCGGCRLALDPGEIGRIRGLAEDEVIRCEECQRILVRTAESGL